MLEKFPYTLTLSDSVDMTQHAWQPGLALKHQMQFPGSCCQIYLQSQAERVSSGTQLCTCLGCLWKLLYLQWGSRNSMVDDELWSVYLWQSTEKRNNEFYFLPHSSTLNTWTCKEKSQNMHMCVHTCTHNRRVGREERQKIAISVDTGLGVRIRLLGKGL